MEHFGKVGHHYYKITWGRDDRPVVPNRVRKSIGAERSFAEDLRDRQEMVEALDAIAQILLQRLAEANVHGHTLTLKVKFSDYTQFTRARTLERCIEKEEVGAISQKLLVENVGEEPVRLLGLTVSNFNQPGLVPKQLKLNLQISEQPVHQRW